MKTIFQGKTKNGKEIIIRYPQRGDEKEMWRYVNELSQERTFVRFQGEEITLKDETKYLTSQLKQIDDKKVITLLAFYKNKLISISDVTMKERTEKHIGVLGISVEKGFRGEGVGQLMLDLILKEVVKEIPDAKIVTLEVYSTNDIAKKIYEKFGFLEYGKLPNGISRSGNLEDAILMYKLINLI